MKLKSNFGAILFGIIAVEVIALIFLFIISDPAGTQQFDRLFSNKSKEGVWDFEEAHPYFGFRLSDRWKDRYQVKSLNNYSFRSVHNFPYDKKENDYVIGVFGGSVAHFFAADHEAVFIEELKKQIPALNSKNIVILNLAMGAGKQPQQFFINSYFIDMFDFVINIDGYNELEAPVSQNFPIEFPYYSESLYQNSVQLKSILGAITLLKDKVLSLDQWESRVFWPFTAKLMLRLSKKKSYSDLLKKNESLTTAKSSKKPFFKERLQFNQSIFLKIDAFKKFASLQSDLLKTRNIPHLFFLQPALGYRKSAVGNEKNYVPYDGFRKRLLDEAYPKIEKAINTLPYVNLTNLFSSQEEVYVDHIHFNKLGNKKMAQEISRAIKDLIN